MPTWISSQAPSPTMVTPSTRWSSGWNTSFTKPSVSPIIWPRGLRRKLAVPVSQGTPRPASVDSVSPTVAISGMVHTAYGSAADGCRLSFTSNARHTATRAWCVDVEASAGNPITSPAAKICGTDVR